jgi:phosphoglycolate phosphatase
LLDTIDDLADSMNKALKDLGYPVYDTEFYKIAVGDGLPKLVERVLPEAHRDEKTIMRCISGMEAEYKKSWNRKTRPYDGIVNLLDTLARHHVRMNVLSNKLEGHTRIAVDFYFPQIPFELVMGASLAFPRKPNPAGALFISKELKIDPQHILFLGDTNTDMKTAVAAGMFPVGALWGFRNKIELEESGARAVIGHPLQLMDYFE